MRKKLIEARDNQTQEKVAKKLGISQDHLSKIELGQRNPSAKLLAKIGKLYNMPVEVLFEDIFLD